MVTENKNIYTELELTPIYNYHKATKGELKYLIIDRSIKESEEDLKKAITLLRDEESELNYSCNSEVYYNDVASVKWLETGLKVVPVLLNLLISTKNNEPIIKELKTWKIFISTKKPIKKQIETAIILLNNSKNKIKRKTDELIKVNKTGDTEISLQKMSIKIHKALGIQANIFKDSVITWFSYFDEINALKDMKSNG